MMVKQTGYRSPLGDWTLISDGTFLTELRIEPTAPKWNLPVFKQTEDWLDRYFAGEQPDPKELPLKPDGTPFQQFVWQLLLEIPYGETSTYGALATQVANRLQKEKMSAQAIGQAVGRNPIPVIIPCHRVLAANHIGGYALGLGMKKALLKKEKSLKMG